MDYVSDGPTNHERQESNSVSYLETAERDADDRRLAEENERLRAEVEGLKANIRVLAEDAFKWREHWIRTNLDPATPPPRVPDSAAEEMFRAKS